MKPTKMPPYRSLFRELISYAGRRQYIILLVSFLILIFGNTFTADHQIVGIVSVYQNLLTGLIVFYNKKFLRYTILGILVVAALLDVLGGNFSFIQGTSWHGLLYLVFFILVVKEVYLEVLYVKTVNTEMLCAALCGFVLLCQISTFLFYLIEIYCPGSFSNIGTGRNVLINLNYFSFTTLLTIGFGDITPLSIIAKRAVMFIGILGHFYTVFVTGIIIGKYLSPDKPSIKE